jgi:hypothetical protein
MVVDDQAIKCKKFKMQPKWEGKRKRPTGGSRELRKWGLAGLAQVFIIEMAWQRCGLRQTDGTISPFNFLAADREKWKNKCGGRSREEAGGRLSKKRSIVLKV